MPTDLPVRSRVKAQSDDWAKSLQPLLIFYGSAGLALLLLIAVESRLGMFDGLTVWDSIIKAADVQSLNDGIDPNWASFPPL